MTKTCCVPNCRSRGGRDPVRFYKIPSSKSHGGIVAPEKKLKRSLWLLALNYTEENVGLHRIVCSRHFETGTHKDDANHPDFVPSLGLSDGPAKRFVGRAAGKKRKKGIDLDRPLITPETSRRPPLDTEFVQCEDYEEQQDERQKVLEEITIKIEPEEETEVKLEDRPPEPTYFKCHPDREAGIVVCLICDSVYHRSEYNEENRHRLGYVTGNLIVCPDHEDLVNDCEDVKVVLAKTGEKLKESEKKYHDLVKVFKKLKEKLDDGGDENVEEVRVAAGKRRRRR